MPYAGQLLFYSLCQANGYVAPTVSPGPATLGIILNFGKQNQHNYRLQEKPRYYPKLPRRLITVQMDLAHTLQIQLRLMINVCSCVISKAEI